MITRCLIVRDEAMRTRDAAQPARYLHGSQVNALKVSPPPGVAA